MADILVRDIDSATKAALQQRAKRNGRSLSAEVRSILRAEAAKPEPSEGFGSRWAKRFDAVGLTDEESEAFQRGLEEARRQPWGEATPPTDQ